MAQCRVGDQLGIPRGDSNIALGQYHVHVGQQHLEERPLAVHPLQYGHAAVWLRVEPRLDRGAETVPARQHQPALRPTENPGNRAQILDVTRSRPGRRTAADVEVGDFAEHRGLTEKAVEARGLENEVTIGAIGLRREKLHCLEILGPRFSRFRLQHCRFQSRRRKDLEVASAELGVRVFAGDDLALLGDADGTLHGTRRLSKDRLIAGPAAAADRAAAAVEQAQPDLMAPEHLDERQLRLVEFPAGGQETAILVAVGIAEHDLLHAAAPSSRRLYSRSPRSSSVTLPQWRKSSIVSNSGTISSSSAPSRGRNRPASFSSTAVSRMSETPVVLEIT